MPIELIEIDEICKDQPGVVVAQCFLYLLHSIRVAFRFHSRRDTAVQKHVSNFADTMDRYLVIMKLVEQHAGRRWNRVVVTVGGSNEMTILPFERSGDHTADF